jgi:ketosteroid isomerase-like protein
MDTKAVVDHHSAAFAAGNLDEILKDYTDESALLTPDATYLGRQAIRAFFSDGFSGLFKPGTYDFTLDIMKIEGDVAYIVWHANCAAATIPLGTDTWVVRDGKIAAQTYTAKIDPK